MNADRLDRTANAAIQTRDYKHLNSEFTKADIPVLNVNLIERAAFRAIFSYGGTIHTLPEREVSNLEKAQENAAALMQELLHILKQIEAETTYSEDVA